MYIDSVVWAPDINSLSCTACCFANHQLRRLGLLPSIVSHWRYLGGRLEFGCGEEAAELGGALAGNLVLPTENEKLCSTKVEHTFSDVPGLAFLCVRKSSCGSCKCLSWEQLVTGSSGQALGRVSDSPPTNRLLWHVSLLPLQTLLREV